MKLPSALFLSSALGIGTCTGVTIASLESMYQVNPSPFPQPVETIVETAVSIISPSPNPTATPTSTTTAQVAH